MAKEIYVAIYEWFAEFAAQIGFGEVWDSLILAIGEIFAK